MKILSDIDEKGIKSHYEDWKQLPRKIKNLYSDGRMLEYFETSSYGTETLKNVTQLEVTEALLNKIRGMSVYSEKLICKF